MQAKVQRIHIEDKKRIIVISDIHGDIDSLKGLLSKIHFHTDDVLILNGDMVEKGTNSLETLGYIMNLCKTNTVYPVCGNCDAIARAVYNEDRNKELLMYLLIRKNSLLNEMCRELSITLDENSDMMQIKELLKKKFENELEWINQLPDIIDTKNFIFAHAGTSPHNMEKQKNSYVRSTKAFLEQGICFPKYCVVGHWPVSLYDNRKPSGNPIIDKEHKIICIDGGNVLKIDGQLNALIIPSMDTTEFTFYSFDKLKSGIAQEDQEESTESHHILWTDNLIHIIKKEEEFTYCEQVSTRKKMWILNKYIYEDKSGFRCEGSTDYKLQVQAGDVVKVVEITKKGYLIKKNGITGWYYGSILMESTKVR